MKTRTINEYKVVVNGIHLEEAREEYEREFARANTKERFGRSNQVMPILLKREYNQKDEPIRKGTEELTKLLEDADVYVAFETKTDNIPEAVATQLEHVDIMAPDGLASKLSLPTISFFNPQDKLESKTYGNLYFWSKESNAKCPRMIVKSEGLIAWKYGHPNDLINCLAYAIKTKFKESFEATDQELRKGVVRPI